MSDTDTTLSPGQVLADRYRLSEEIGRGGFGRVYRARQLNMDRDVAVKILPPKFMAQADVAERFRREARLASRLRHPHTITVHDYGKQDNLLFIVMELLEGQDLADVLMDKPTVPIDRILHIGRQVLGSLDEAHSHNIIHRDLKPENIFLTRVGADDDFVKVVDFGIAKLAMPDGADTDRPSRRKLTMSGSTVGTPTYMSPEQAAGEQVDALTDLYALGVILYEMACGRPPFEDKNPVKVMRSHLFDEIPRFPDGPLRDSRFEAVIRQAIAKDKQARIQSAAEFLAALDQEPTAMVRAGAGGTDTPASQHANRDSGRLALDETAAFEAQSSEEMSPRAAHNTDGALTVEDADTSAESGSIPFESVTSSPPRDRVPQAAAARSGMTDASGLTSRSDLHTDGEQPANRPPTGFESGASTSSIITVLEPGSEDDVILLTNKKGDNTADDDRSAEPKPSQTAPPNPQGSTPPGSADAGIESSADPLQHPDDPDTSPTGASRNSNSRSAAPARDAPNGDTQVQSADQEWGWGKDDQPQISPTGQPHSPRNSSRKTVVTLTLLLIVAAAAGYLYYADSFALF